MTFTIYAFLLLAICASVHPKMCTPDQWEGSAGSLGGYVNKGRPGIIKEFMEVHYDYKNQRSAVHLFYENDDYKNEFQLVNLYKGDVGHLYVVNLKDDSCWIKKLDRPFRQACIPDDAEELGEYYLGLSGGLKLTSYAVKRRGLSTVIAVETKGDVIIPATENVYGNLWGVAFMQGLGFTNITAGIKDPTVFDVPEDCEPKEDMSMMEELTREHYILAL